MKSLIQRIRNLGILLLTSKMCAREYRYRTYLCQEGGPEHAGLQEEKAVLLTSKMYEREYRYRTYLCQEGGPKHAGLQEEKAGLLTSKMCVSEYR